MITTLKDYFLAVLRYWWALVPGVVMVCSDLATWHRKKEFHIPLGVRLAITGCAVLLAQFLAYRNQASNLTTAVEEKRELSISNNALQAELSKKKDENDRLTSENAGLKGQIPSGGSLKVRALQAANEFEHFWKTRSKERTLRMTGLAGLRKLP